jgi:glycine/D-amino acid oxidase-like deaminating enzyme
VTGCPLEDLPAVVWDILEAAELMRKGLPPVAGGLLDQARGFVDAARYVWATRRELMDGDLRLEA